MLQKIDVKPNPIARVFLDFIIEKFKEGLIEKSR